MNKKYLQALHILLLWCWEEEWREGEREKEERKITAVNFLDSLSRLKKMKVTI